MEANKLSSVPASLVQHLTNKLGEAIRIVKTSETSASEFASKVVNALLADEVASSSNKKLLEVGTTIAKCLRVYPDMINSLDEANEINIKHILTVYDDYVTANNTVFANIKGHHDHIGTVDWSTAAKNETDLATYSTAAEKMGDRLWVQTGNDWMKNFAIQFFKDGGAKKHYMRVLREKYLAEHGVEWPNNDSIQCNNSLQRDLLPKSNKIRLLDVGSCYNPFANSSTCLDVTALDLYPADPSVLQCDFLNLVVGSPDSAAVTVAPTNNNTSSSGSSSSSSAYDSHTALDPNKMTKLLQLPAGSYDVITMSLVLNYLPSPIHRELMVAKARQLLIGLGHNQQPHHRGLLLIVEKHSIFGKDQVDRPDLYCAGKGALLKNFKQSICNLGFELVKYREMEPVNNRRSHLFAFATVDVDADVLSQQCEKLSDLLKSSDAGGASVGSALNSKGEDGQLLPRLWIKQDFDAALYGRESKSNDQPTSDGGGEVETKNRKRDRDEEVEK